MGRHKHPKAEVKRNGLLNNIGAVCFDLPCGVSIKSEKTEKNIETRDTFYFPKGSYD